ncbi:DEHA2D13860p [Debaryomyces hansenii CBS767]|uniref:DEHA2D13860p n=1 Tax=Debaryomyces hansenii (strain ATCC 36239 / CBS 767 / BCRC 21394 / JCM 1990 / NBRC 0083 / IGC 2968) TaxID=284592 RepID=Q6BRU0_DEBHA|nr:DEHA2D13860p [Debaryomyces hansenii CBS767]CAG87248.2 DEHA2D13860p [Debaryomyces hansenii CBS767]|eukprot:XP_459080.2 DEHA2D13860p [Debaryomyces hansenii CBS767]
MKIHLKKKISDSFRIKKKYSNLYLDHLHILEFSIVCLHLILFDSLFLVMMRNDITDPINEKANPNSLSSKFAFPWAKSVNRTCMSGPIPEASNNGTNILDCCQLETDGQGSFVDNKGRKIVLKGINVDGASKFPCTPNLPSYAGNGSEPDNIFFEGEQVSFVGRPFPLEEAEVHFERIKSWGYNTIRYLITWEALEHFGPCKYDDDFIAYTIDMLRIINRVGGLYVFVETHQDVWSRFSGGSGAPMWTLHAAGLQPRRFAVTEAAILHNEERFHRQRNPDNYDRMVWTTNYKRLATLVMFTVFFSGEMFFPNCKINGENIQSYLQRHYFNSIKYFWKAVTSALPEMLENGSLVGFESMNEPSCGLLGYQNIEEFPCNQQLRVGTTPTVFQAMKLGMGLSCKIDVYKIAITGPQKNDFKIVDPMGERAWLMPEESKFYDDKYHWKRDPNWKIGECLFAQHGIWQWDEDIDFTELKNYSEHERLNISDNKCKVIIPDYFSKPNKNHNFSDKSMRDISLEYFCNNNFVDFYISFKATIRSVTPDCFLLIEPPVLEIPPKLKGDHRHIIDSKTVYAPHYYDGMSLLFKTWNDKYNVDTLGIMRGRYYNPVMGLVIGERSIRNCIKKQFLEMKRECEEHLGSIPILMSETGMPFDMDEKQAYCGGKYHSQTSALDAISNALEGSNMSHTYWCYTSINCHKWGDRWNNEDFSFWSPEDRIDCLKHDTNLSNDSAPNSKSNTPNSTRRSSVTGNNMFSLRLSSRRLSESMLKSKIRRQSLKLGDTISNSFTKLDLNGQNNNINNNNNGNENIKSNENNNAGENGDSSTESDTFNKDDAPKFNSKFSFDNKETGTSDIQSNQSSTLISSSTYNVKYRHYSNCYSSPDGVRAVSAVIRPYAIASVGTILNNEFHMKAGKFILTVKISKQDKQKKNIPTVIFVPKWHYPYLNYGDIELTSGYVKYNSHLQYLEWFHEDLTSESTTKNARNTEETIVIKNYSGRLEVPPPSGNLGQTGCPVT